MSVLHINMCILKYACLKIMNGLILSPLSISNAITHEMQQPAQLQCMYHSLFALILCLCCLHNRPSRHCVEERV